MWLSSRPSIWTLFDRRDWPLNLVSWLSWGLKNCECGRVRVTGPGHGGPHALEVAAPAEGQLLDLPALDRSPGVGAVGLEERRLLDDLDRLGHGADLEDHVDAHRGVDLHLDAVAGELLEAAELRLDAVEPVLHVREDVVAALVGDGGAASRSSGSRWPSRSRRGRPPPACRSTLPRSVPRTAWAERRPREREDDGRRQRAIRAGPRVSARASCAMNASRVWAEAGEADRNAPRRYKELSMDVNRVGLTALTFTLRRAPCRYGRLNSTQIANMHVYEKLTLDRLQDPGVDRALDRAAVSSVVRRWSVSGQTSRKAPPAIAARTLGSAPLQRLPARPVVREPGGPVERGDRFRELAQREPGEPRLRGGARTARGTGRRCAGR